MKTLRYAFWAVVGLCLIVIGLANLEPTLLRAMPERLAELLGLPAAIELPLFVVLFIGVGLGLLIGFLWEWLREYRMRAESRAKSRELAALRLEVSRLRDTDGDGRDDVIQLLESR